MQFNDTTNKNGILQRCEDYSNFADGTITDDSVLTKKFTANVNETIHELTTDIILLNDDFDFDDPNKTDYPIATTPLVADQRDYQFDSISFLKIKRVDVSYDSSTYYRATPFNSTAYEEALGNDVDVDSDFQKTAPNYDPKGFGFWLYPRADAGDVTNGGLIRVEFMRSFTEFATTDTDKEPPIDRPFHDLVAIGASLKYSAIKGGDTVANLAAMYEQGRDKLKQHYATRNEDAFVQFTSNQLNTFK